MVNFKKLTDRAKNAVEKRGGADAFKQDASEVAGIMKGKGSLKDKAKQAAAAIKDSGTPAEASAAGEGTSDTAATEAAGGAADPKP